MTFTRLEAERIVQTAEHLQQRITERFPDSSLSKVALALHGITANSAERVRWIAKPMLGLRSLSWLLATSLVGAVAYGLLSFGARLKIGDFSELLADLDSGLAVVVFLGAILLFLVSLEARFKRSRVLRALDELRALAHVIDMHQLTKDPDALHRAGSETASSPKRTLTPFLLGRYLDYCSEMLSIVSKVAALYVQDLNDTQLVAAVQDMEAFTTGLARKVWQKIMLLDRQAASERPYAANEPPTLK